MQGGNARGPRLAASTRRSYAAYVRTFYRRAAALRWIGRDPMAAVCLPPCPLGPPRALDLADVARLLRDTRDDGRLRLMVWLAYGAGLRAAEIAGLRREDVQLTGRAHLVVTGKGRRTRTVPLNRRLAAVLRAELHGGATVGPVVSSRHVPGRALRPQTVSRLLSVVLRGAGIAASGHSLRHTFATELLAAGKGHNFRAVQRLLGHQHASSTERYVAAYDQDAYDAVALLPDPQRPAPRPSAHPLDVAAAIARQRRHYLLARPPARRRHRRRGPDPRR